MKIQISFKWLAFIAVLSFITGCASMASSTLSTSAEYGQVFAACRQAATETSFGVTSENGADGLISAQQSVVGGNGSAVQMSIQVTKVNGKTQVEVSVVPPPGTVGDTKGYVATFTEALKKRIPDVTVISKT